MLARLFSLGAFAALLWAILIVNVVTGLLGLDFRDYGIKPRSSAGLWGVPLHVFLHGNLAHLLANTVPLLILGGLTAVRVRTSFLGASAFIALGGGALVWIFARPNTNHIGASGLVFGFFGYLVGQGIFRRSVLSIIIAFAVIGFYGFTILFGVLPLEEFVSWEGHLFGLIAGVFYAFLEGGGRGRGEGRE